MDKYKKYLKLCVLFALILCLSLVGNYILITNAYENISYKDMVEIQQKTEAIWGSALNPHTATYKFELYKYKKPELIALGSSQSYQFREQFFNRSFVNCGGVMVFLNWGRVFLQEIIKIHKPHLVILTLDFWYFNDQAPKPESDLSFPDKGTDYLVYKLRQPFVWLWTKKLTLTEYFKIIIFKDNRNQITNYNNMGMLAIKRSDGFRKDGSYSYAGYVTEFSKNVPDRNFALTLKEVADRTDKFIPGANLSDYSIQELDKIIKLCQEQNIKLVVILPPISFTLYQHLQAMPKEYEYIAKFRQYVRSLPVEAYDFLNIKDVVSDDCECIDGLHAGDVTIQKMLLTILKQNPQTILLPYLNVGLMQKGVREYEGRAMTRYDKARYNFKEVDFLAIGCAK